MEDKKENIKENVETTINSKSKPKRIIHTNSTYIAPGEKPKRLTKYKLNYRKIKWQ